jgi:hypothetical protein
MLRPGDIVLTTSPEPVSKIIRTVTSSDISHAMVCVDYACLIDATRDGVHARNTQRHFLSKGCAVHVLRLNDPMRDEQLHRVISHLRNFIGTEYATAEAMLAPFGGVSEPTQKQFCSRLVAQAFASAGIQLVDDPSFCTPGDIQASEMLEEVLGAVLEVTSEEIDRWGELADTPQLMRDTTNVLLKGVREVNPHIQTINDIDRHLIEHPQDDAQFCRILGESGYLTAWYIERQNNPWQYDLALMQQGPPEEIEKYCLATVASRDDENRYAVNLDAYKRLSSQYGLKYFFTKVMLYEQLKDLTDKRMQVAGRWLQERQKSTN